MKTKLFITSLLLQFIAIKTFAQQGQALNFNFNANTNVSLSNNIQLADSFTIEAWIYPESKSDFSTIIGNKSPGLASPGYFLAINNYSSNDGRIVFETQNATNATVSSVTWNQWQHIAITWNGSIVRMYINGVAQTLNDSTFMNLQPSPSPCYIGDIPAYFGNGNYHGNLDELRIWNYAKSQQELQQDMLCQLNSTPLGLLAYYQFNEGVANSTNTGVDILPDLSGNNITGSLFNFVLDGTSTNWIAPGGVFNMNVTQLGNTLNAEQGASSYQWVICDSVNTILPNETNMSFSPLMDGNYAVIATLGNCTAQSVCTPMVVTKMNDHDQLFFNLYPNPAKDFILIMHQKIGDVYAITNLQGIVIDEGKFTTAIEKIEINHLPSGMYFICNKAGQHSSFIKY